MALKKVLTASCLLACCVMGQAQAADSFTVKDIRIEGLQRVTWRCVAEPACQSRRYTGQQ